MNKRRLNILRAGITPLLLLSIIFLSLSFSQPAQAAARNYSLTSAQYNFFIFEFFTACAGCCACS